jgi:hypothetical protein
MHKSSSTFAPQARSRHLRWLTILVLAVLLGGCGGGGSGAVSGAAPTGGSATSAEAGAPGTLLDVTISGSVGDGPVTGATVTVYDVNGAVVDSTVSDSAANFRKTVQVKGKQYPLRLIVSGGVDLVTGQAPDFKMVSVMLRPSDKAVNINPYSTLIVNTAERMPGGLTGANVGLARTTVLDKLGFGLDVNTVPDPITTPITATNAANIIKASEAVGELVRRTRDLIRASGRSASGSSVVSALASDLVDGFVDGLGAAGTNSIVSAVANVVSAQILVESMSNTLRVGGVIATNVIDQSIRSTHPGVSNSQLSGSVRINGQMITQAGIALAAVQVLDSSAAVATVGQTVAGLTANSTSTAVASVLPADTTLVLASASGQVAGTSSANLTLINQIVFAQGDTGTQTASTDSTTTGTTGGTTTDSSGGSTGSTDTTGSTGGTTGSTGGTTGSTGGTSGGSTGTATGSFTVSWTAPAARSDGTPLTLSSIGGYRIYYGTQRGNYPSSMGITNGSASSATVNNLSSGTYYLVMTTYDSLGLESRYSGEVVKNVP